ncbi:serine hydrolase [Brevibacillus nitrificans]|uniref:serine hydrolase domain-containing protein n=1 Tax=Brevibacillus nitrificans TaxID=651560 RepID=UPI002E1BA170|nr:serine hydrolase [Brevibacillus nitrificans]
MKKRTGAVIMLCLCMVTTWSVLAMDGPEGEKKAKPVAKPISHAWDGPGKSLNILRSGKPSEAGMAEEPFREIDAQIEAAIRQNQIPGAVMLVARRGVIVKEQAYGFAAKYKDEEFTPMQRPIVMQTDTIFDLASISKLFTSTAVMQLVDQGLLQLDAPVARYLPDFAANGKQQVTIRQLLTHTSGFPAYIHLFKKGNSRAERMQYVLDQPLVQPPGSAYVYSDLNMIVLGAVVEKLSAQTLDAYVQTNILTPLGMSHTMYKPPGHLREHISATEYQSVPKRGLVWGEVQDENAWSLGGVSGHAGLFGTARDLAIFAQMMLNGGSYREKRILSEQAVAWMTENQLPAFPGDEQGLGWELARGTYMDALCDSKSMGHTGFTGTSLVVSPNQETIGILLTNRVHPIRDTESITPLRNQVFRQVARSIPVDIPWQEGAWFAGMGDDAQSTLTATANLAAGGTLAFDTWYRLENEYDFGYVEASVDGKEWRLLGSPATGESDWTRVSLQVPPGTRYVRFRYATDETINGRGWFLHQPVLLQPNGKEWSVSWKAEGWKLEQTRKEEDR